MSTTNTNYSRGSEWRKWDLHVHSPASFHWKGERMTSENKAQLLESFVDKVNSSDVSVYCIMDYWTFDWCIELINYVKQNPGKLEKTVLYGMELRVECPVNYRLNIHVILSDKLSEQNLNDFKSELKIRIGNTQKNLSDDSLIQLAKSFDASKARTHGFGEPQTLDDKNLLELGSKTAEVTKDSLIKAFEHIPRDSGYVLLPYDTSDGLADLDWSKHPQDDNYFMQTASIFETRDYRNIDLFNGVKTESNKSFFDNFYKTLGNKPKPCISGSDAHKFEDYGKYPSNKITWIKADPTFEGLKQIIYEPRDRVYIGDTPSALVELEKNPEKFIENLKISEKEENTSDKNLWFQDVDIPINRTGLISIIGNKGSGKSAIADIIALLGNAEKAEDSNLSFLTKKKFKDPKKGNLAQKFEANLSFSNNNKITHCLDDPRDSFSSPKVRYIPQNYFETITNEDQEAFQNALDGVIFEYIPEAQRLGRDNFDKLISYKQMTNESEINFIQNTVNTKIQELAELESQCKQETKDHYQQLLKEAKDNLELLEKQRPEKPTTKIKDDPETQSKQNQLNNLIKKLEKTNEKINKTQEDVNQLYQNKEKLEQFNAKIESLEREYKHLGEQYTSISDWKGAEGNSIADIVGQDFGKIINFDASGKIYIRNKLVGLDALIKEKQLLLEQADFENLESFSEVDNSENKSLFYQKSQQEKKINTLKEKLAEPSKKYHEYTEKIKLWGSKKKELEGSVETKTGLNYYEWAVDYLENRVEEKRDEKINEIYDEIKKIYKLKEEELEVYKSFKTSIDNQIKEKKLIDVNISIEAKIELEKSFKEEYLKYIDKNRRGNYQGNENARKKLDSILEYATYTSFEGVKNLFQEMIKSFRNHDKNQEPLEITDPVKDLNGFYQFLFSLDYLKTSYQLKLDDKSLEELSPGEKGSLLLIFYLVLDKEKIPLIIDQPEDNLDNKSVYQKLSHFIRQAKKERQVIIVTHNPNLAIGADTEQIIYVEIDKQDGKNEFIWESGSIENTKINKKIVEILEGTKPAFDKRRLRYTQNN